MNELTRGITTRAEIKDIVCACLKQLRDEDYILLDNDVSERAITHKLAEHLQRYFTDLKVDCEYNRNAEFGEGARKWIRLQKDQLPRNVTADVEEGEWVEYSPFPDIIVHHRGDNKNNLLIIEVKKMNGGNSQFDYHKLSAFTQFDEENDYHYEFGISIMLDTGPRTSRQHRLAEPVLQWCIKGSMETKQENC